METVYKLTTFLNKTEQEILKLALNAPYRYKVYSIPKRTHGRRIIAQPTKVIKELQKAFLQYKIFPCHPNTMSYRKGISIKDNALHHVKNSYLLKMDFSNFFNSLTPDIFWGVWENFWPLPSRSEKKVIESILFWKDQDKLCLSIGAPSSPTISNFCLYFFDEIISKYCTFYDINYSRYADDLTFSTENKRILFSVPDIIEMTLFLLFNKKISINHQKTIFSSKAHNRHVTGITLTNENKISIGRSRKRYIKHLIHQYKLRKFKPNEIKHLQGLISFANQIEPNFIKSLEKKYSITLIERIIKGKENE